MYKSKYKPKRRHYTKKRKRPSGMQKIKRTRWPTRNPFGDNLFYKFKTVTGGTALIANGTSFVQIKSFQLNALNLFITNIGDAPGIANLANAFHKYRVMGVKFKVTFYPTGTTAATQVPMVAWFDAGPDQNWPSPSISVTPELRWSKYRVLQNATNGGKPVTLRTYYSVNRTFGPDSVVKNDSTFIGNTTTSTPWATASTEGPYFQLGIFTMSGANTTGDVPVVYKLEAVVYTKFFAKRELTQ